MAEALFRNEVIEASRDRLTGTVIAAVPPSARLYTRMVLAVAAALVLLLIFGSYTMTTDVRGIVAYDAGVTRVYPRSAAEVAEIQVQQGDKVSAGQPLVTLAVAQGQWGLAPQLNQLAAQDGELARQISLSTEQSSSELTAIERQGEGYAASLASLKRQRAIAGDQIGLAEAALRRAQRLAQQGAGTERQVEDSRSALLARRAEFEALGEQIAAQQSALGANQAERNRRLLEAQVAQSRLQAQRAQLAEQQAQLARDNRLVLTAPMSGTIGDISVEVGQRANPERSVVSVIPENSKLEIWLYAPTRAVGRARVGQKVRIQFDAFPYEKYGTGSGVVTEVARVPTEPGNLDPGLNVTEPVFRLRAQIEKVSPRATVALDSLRPGMTLNAKLELESRSLWQVLFGPVMQALGQ